jgi:ATP/maltotriose-dependent transcriptional regulator MalT
MTYFGDSQAAIQVAREALADLGDPGSPLALRLESSVSALMWQDARWARGEFETSLPALLELVERGGEHGRGLALTLSAALAARGQTDRALRLVDVGLDHGAFLSAESISGIELPQAINGLAWSEQSDRALALGAEYLAEARRRGSIFGAIGAGIQLGLTLWRRGELAEAEAELTQAEGLAAEHGALPPHIFSQAYLAYVRVWRGNLEEVPSGTEPLPDAPVASALLTAQHARAVVRRARGDRPGAIADLRGVGEQIDQIGTVSPGVLGWRSELAELLAADDPDEARAYAEEDLRLAREAGLSVAEGIALRALATIEPTTERVELLRRSADVLEPSFARLEHARSLTELGVALREGGNPKEARPLLVAALDQAHRCGAQPLAERARAEAVAAGARPRRPRLTGVEALTPSELRVSRLAAEGLSNREIAQALFVTTKTVADHLAASYRKLGIRRREGLPKALAEPTPSG